MKWSKYIVTYKKGSSIVALSTLSKAIVEITNEQFDNPSILTKAESQFLCERHLLVDENFDEDAYVWYIINKDRLNTEAFFASIMFTEKCNFNCVYCYQKSQVQFDDLTTQKQDHIIEWITSKIIKGNYRICNIELYGGEPLLKKKQVISFCKDLKSKLSPDVQLNFRLITNGYLLDLQTVNTLFECGLKDIHLTLDGDEDTHNKRRPLKNGKGSYHKILENLKEIVSNVNIPIMLRIGFDKSNYKNIPVLLKYLHSNIDFENIEVYFAPIYNTTQQVNNSHSFCSENVLNGRELAETYKFLFNEAKTIGITIPLFLSSGPCMFWAENAVIIDVHGNVYKCLDMVGIDELSVGNVIDNTYKSKYYEIMKGNALNECIQQGCKYVPLCGGGCMMQSYTYNKTFKKSVCNYDLFNEVIPFLLSLVDGGE